MLINIVQYSKGPQNLYSINFKEWRKILLLNSSWALRLLFNFPREYKATANWSLWIFSPVFIKRQFCIVTSFVFFFFLQIFQKKKIQVTWNNNFFFQEGITYWWCALTHNNKLEISFNGLLQSGVTAHYVFLLCVELFK